MSDFTLLHLARTLLLELIQNPIATWSQESINTAATCFNIACSTISGVRGALQAGILGPANWSIIYSLFLAIVYIISLGDYGDEEAISSIEAHQQIVAGLQLLAALRCVDNSNAALALHVLKVSVLRISTHSIQTDSD